MAPPTSKVALVTGANGISGFSIVEHLIRQSKEEWCVLKSVHALYPLLKTDNLIRSKIVVTSRRPLPAAWIDPRVEFVVLDFLETVESIITTMKPICADVTHAFFTSYVHCDDFKLLRDKNVPLFRNFLDATVSTCPKLHHISLQTGGKVITTLDEYYSIQLAKSFILVLWCPPGTGEGPLGGEFPAL